MGTTGIGIGLCYTQYNATANSYFSFNYSCVNDSGVFVTYYNESTCSGMPFVDTYVPIELTGFDEINCGTNTDCVATYTQYENSDATTCDLDTASFEEFSVVVDTCISNGTRSTKYGCYHGKPARRDWYNADCSGGYDDLGVADGCECDYYDYECQITIVDGLDCDISEGTVFENCSFAIADDFLPIVMDYCYNARNEDGDKFSIYYGCVDMWNIWAGVYFGYDCSGTRLIAENVKCFFLFLLFFCFGFGFCWFLLFLFCLLFLFIYLFIFFFFVFVFFLCVMLFVILFCCLM